MYTPETLLQAYKKGSDEDQTGLYELIGQMEMMYPSASADEIQVQTLRFVRTMLSEGFVAGNLQRTAPYYSAWTNQDAEYVINRIKTEWNALGRIPNIGDIVYFDLSPSK